MMPQRAQAKIVVFITAVSQLTGQSAIAQQPAAAKNDWRPMVYSDLRLVSNTTKTYADIWADKITANNKSYAAAGDNRFAVGNAPASEAHFVVRSPVKVVVASILNTVAGCTVIRTDLPMRVSVKRCALRLAIYSSGANSVSDAGTACFIEYGKLPTNMTPDQSRNAAYAAYDVVSRTIKTGLVLGGQALDECSINIPVPGQ